MRAFASRAIAFVSLIAIGGACTDAAGPIAPETASTTPTINPAAAAVPTAPTNALVFQTFESGAIGTWDDRGQPAQQRVVNDPALAYSGTSALEVTYPQGSGGGWLTKFFAPGYDSVTVSYYVRFDANWQGGTYLLGLRGSRTDNLWSAFGRAGSCPTGSDYFNATIFADYNGNPGDVRFYSYYPGMSTSGCYGDTGTGRATYVAPLTMSRGDWHRIDYSVKLNRIGQSDGAQRLYVDGVLRGEWTGMTFRTSSILTLNSVTFDFGSRGAPQTQRLWIDDISVVHGYASTTTPPPPTSTAPVAAVAVTPSSNVLTVGQGTQLQATLRDANGNVLTGRSITWSSSYPAVINVNSSGYVTTTAAGSVTITATSEGRTGTAVVSAHPPELVPPPPTTTPGAVASVSVSPSATTLTVGQGVQLQAALRDANGNLLTGRTVTWSSSYPAVINVSPSGYVTTTAVGSVTITATSEGRTGTAIVSAHPATTTAPAPSPSPVASVSVSPSATTLTVGQGVQLQATLRDASGNVLTGRSVTWSSSYPAVINVNSSGYVTTTAPGSVTITATSEGRTGTAIVSANPTPSVAVASVSVTPGSASLQPGQTVQLSAVARDASGNALSGRTISWSTSNPALATVSASGLVTAVAAGSVTIGATSEGRTGTSSISISAIASTPAPVSTIAVTPTSASLTVGQGTQLQATLRDASGNVLTGRTVTWSSSNATVATVSGSGYVTALAAGSATITATSEGRSATASVSVTAPVTTPPIQGGAVSLWSKDFEDGTWANMNAPFGAPSGPHAIVNDAANCAGGSRCYRYTMPSSALYSVNEFYVDGGRTHDELYWSVDFKITNIVRGQLKGLRFTSGTSNDLGGAYFMGRASDGSSGIGFAFGGEAGGVQLATGIWFGPRSSQFASAGGTTHLENAVSSGYHRLTIHYQRNGTAQPRVRFWIDGRPVVQPQGAALAIDGYTWGASQGGANWVNGAAGEPSWLVPASRGTSSGIGGLRMFDQMSSTGNSGYIYVDNMRVSTTPIAP